MDFWLWYWPHIWNFDLKLKKCDLKFDTLISESKFWPPIGVLVSYFRYQTKLEFLTSNSRLTSNLNPQIVSSNCDLLKFKSKFREILRVWPSKSKIKILVWLFSWKFFTQIFNWISPILTHFFDDLKTVFGWWYSTWANPFQLSSPKHATPFREISKMI